MKYGSLFSGIGGFDLGFDRAGMECAWQVEIDKHAHGVLQRHWPDVQKFEDVRNVGKRELGAVDLICGGTPCQDFSIAGKRAGLDGERSGLWFEFHRIVMELKPRWVVLENVPGILSQNGGRDFAIILGGLTGVIPKVPARGWGNAGAARGPLYNVAYRICDAQFYGIPQRRRRVFVVGHLGYGRAAQVLFESEGSAWDSAPSRETGTRVAALTKNGVGATGADDNQAQAGHLIAFAQNTRDELRLINGDGSITGALSAQPGMKQQTYVAFGGNNTQCPINVATACNAHGSRRYDFESETFVFQPRFARNGRGAPDSIAAPLTAEAGRTGKGDSAQCIAFDYCLQGSSRTQIARTGGDYAQLQASRPDAIASPSFGVRRLTPTECERLQGFPDGWTDDQSDTQRYKQCGNAVNVKVAEWLGKRIVEVQK